MLTSNSLNMPDDSKRAASSSPNREPSHDVKRLRLSPDLWSEEEHLKQDNKVKQLLLGAGGRPRKYDVTSELNMALVLKFIGEVALAGPNSTLLRAPDDYINALEDSPDLMELVGDAYTNRTFRDVRCHSIFRKEPVTTESTMPPYHILATYGQEKAVEDSWVREFSGDAARALWSHIQEHYRKDNRIYAHYAAIVQSSGMGKSRTVDELAKEHFVIPINLRDANTTGYPPADDDAREFLTAGIGQVEAYDRACAFLEALFEQTTAVVLEQLKDCDENDMASRFRTLMTEGQKFGKPNKFRRDFYKAVVDRAKAIQDKLPSDTAKRTGPNYRSPSSKLEYDFGPARACNALTTILGGGGREQSPTPFHSSQGTHRRTRPGKTETNAGPFVILAFDEAHIMTERNINLITTWSKFSELRHALRALQRFPCFSLFMSTTGKISQFTSAPGEDDSRRLVLGKLVLIQPFTDLGFDILARKICLENDLDLENLVSNDHMAHCGRPLFGSLYDCGDKAVREDIITFAVAKLLNAEPGALENLSDDQKLACISQRLPLEFNSTTYISQANERKQVEGHMRVCLKIDAAFESMITVSASEPILSEAAYSVMARPSFNVPKAMKSVFDGFSIDKGNRGEFLIMLLFTVARDEAVGPPDDRGMPKHSRIIDVAPFLTENLFKNQLDLQTLHDDFPDAKMHFNHYVKVHEYAVIDAESLMLLFSRGAGILCANNQYAIDGINPFLCDGTKLGLNNLGLILWQGKNDSAFTATPRPGLFEAMDVYKLRILKAGDAPIPLIKIVFALAAKTPSINVVRHPPSTTGYNAVVYDIWCAGISPDILNVVEPTQASVWAALLQASYGWRSIYEVRGVDKDLRRSMNPGAACDFGHWNRWSTRSDW